MTRVIKQAAVLGAGVMGATIAAHLANVGIPSYLLDIIPQEPSAEELAKGLTLEHQAVRDRLAVKAKQQLLKSKPAPLYVASNAELITPGNLEDHLEKLAEVDWVIEVVVERLEVKKALLQKVAQVCRPGTIISSNTSGISINRMVEDLPLGFRQYFLGTHFFNPPRYMKLLELIPARDTLPEVLEFMQAFGTRVLGKGVVVAKDTPNFIANRVGVFGMLATARAMEEAGLTVEQVDAVTGTALGRPKSASFRTLDMVGLDTFVHVANNVRDNVANPEEQALFTVPKFLLDMVSQGMLGDKSRQGFYKKVKNGGKTEVLALDYRSMEYRPKEKAGFASLEAAQAAGGLKERMRALVFAGDEAGRLAWTVTKQVLVYTAEHALEMADDLTAVDNAMKWGFNWQFGPFETWDALGVEQVAARLQKEGEPVPALVSKLLAGGKKSFYLRSGRGLACYDPGSDEYKTLESSPGVIILKSLKEEKPVIKANPGASLVDLGDGVACLEFHSPSNAIGSDIIAMIDAAVDEVEKNWQGLVIGNQGKNFCVGANLMLVLLEAEDENWDDIDLMVRQFQQAMLRLKYCSKPVVAAPHAMALGGGAEVCLHSHRVRAAAETYLGLVELGVGLIPAGGGTKEMVYRSVEGVPGGVQTDLQPFVNKAFETIAMAKVSTSGPEAKQLGYLRDSDGITVSQDHLLQDAKATVLAMASEGFVPLRPKQVRVVGQSGAAVLRLGAYTLQQGGYISEYDRFLADKVAHVLAGGNVPANTPVTEQYLLDLEREAFLSLCGEPKTQDRMRYMLSKGKPLRN